MALRVGVLFKKFAPPLLRPFLRVLLRNVRIYTRERFYFKKIRVHSLESVVSLSPDRAHVPRVVKPLEYPEITIIKIDGYLKYFYLRIRVMTELSLPNMNERDSIPEIEHSYDFTHFDTSYQCEIYLRNNPHISFHHKCCGGKGYAIIKGTRTLSPVSPTACPKKPAKPKVNSKGNCDICFVEDSSLYSMCTQCIQPFCMNCLKTLKKPICPNCRSELRVF